MSTLKVKTVKGSVDIDGNVVLTLTHLDETKEDIPLGKIPFAETSGKKIDQSLSDTEKGIVKTQLTNLSETYLEQKGILSEDQIKQKGEAFLKSIESGERTPDFVGYR